MPSATEIAIKYSQYSLVCDIYLMACEAESQGQNLKDFIETLAVLKASLKK